MSKQDVRIEALQNELDKMKKSNYSGRILFLFKKKHLFQLRNSLLKHFKDQAQNQTKKKVTLNSLSGLFWIQKQMISFKKENFPNFRIAGWTKLNLVIRFVFVPARE